MVYYTGTCPEDAGRLIDLSHGRASLSDPSLAHARGHAKGTSGRQYFSKIDCIENYSRGCEKSSFWSREDQDEALHFALTSREGELAIEKLNSGSTSETVFVSIRHLRMAMAKFCDGRQLSHTTRARWVKIILRHPGFVGESIHIHNCFTVG